MVDVLETEYLDFKGNFDNESRNNLLCKMEDDLQLQRGDRAVKRALEDIVESLISNPGLLRMDGSLDEYLLVNYGEHCQRFANFGIVIKNAFANSCNQAICQVALLSAERQKTLLNDASKKRANGYTHGLSSMLYECTLYRTEPCQRISFLDGSAFFDVDAETNYQRFRQIVAEEDYKEFMPIHGWDRTKIPNTSFADVDQVRDNYYNVLKHSIRFGYRYEDHAFHERLMLRGYTGVVLYNYQMIPFDKQASAVFDRSSIAPSIGEDDDDSVDEMYLTYQG